MINGWLISRESERLKREAIRYDTIRWNNGRVVYVDRGVNTRRGGGG